jgi:hypothetical protein
MPTPIEVMQQWCEKARGILGTASKSSNKAQVRGLSKKDLRQVRHEFDDTAVRIGRLTNFPDWDVMAQSYMDDYNALVKRLQEATERSQTEELAREMLALRKEVDGSLEDAAQTRAAQRWPGELANVTRLQPRDALLALNRIDKEIAGFRGKAKGEWAKQLDGHANSAREARKGLAERMQRETEDQVKRWQEEVGQVRINTELQGAKLLKVIERLRREMAQLNANRSALGLGAAELSAVGLGELESRYEAGFPKRTEGATAAVGKAVEMTKPELIGDGMAILDFLNTPLIGKNWFTLKKLFKEGHKEVTEERMKQAWALRQKMVDDYMADPIRAKYHLPNVTGYLAAGSVTLESDIDVTILDHHWSGGESGKGEILKTDAQIVKEFNDWFMGKYKAQPGVMFDVNLYASAKPRKPLAKLSDQTPVKQAMTSMTNAGQDMGALMKMRRFMSWEEFQNYQDEVLKEMHSAGASPEDVQTTKDQFETADADYQVALQESLDKALELLQDLKEPTEEQAKALKLVKDAKEAALKLPLVEAQALLAAAAKKLEHMQEVAMWVNNELYVKGVAEVRKLEEEVDALQKKIDDGQLGPASPEAREMAGKVARLKVLATESVYYANEAYHSEGPFVHIVEATQGVKQSLAKTLNREPTPEEVKEEQKKRREALSVHLCLQSFNEQLGDLLKDLDHYAGEDNPGTGFYRASKYLERLLDALALLQSKLEGVKLDFDPAKLAAEVAGSLLAARKGLVKFESLDPTDANKIEQETQAYAIEQMQKMFGVKTLSALGTKLKGIGAKVNAQARKAIAAEMRGAKEHEKAYFGG